MNTLRIGALLGAYPSCKSRSRLRWANRLTAFAIGGFGVMSVATAL